MWRRGSEPPRRPWSRTSRPSRSASNREGCWARPSRSARPRLACSLESDDRSAIDFPLDLKAFGEDYPDQVGDLKKLEARHSERVDKVLLPSRRTLLNELAKLEKRLVKEGRVKDALAVRAQHERTEAVIRWPGTKKSIPEGALQWNGNYYHFYDKKMNWTEAKKFCEKLGGHLVVLTSPEENAQVAKLHGGTYCWIGATDEKSEGEFKWVTGEPFEYTRWHHRPDNLEGRQHYLIYHATSGWDDVVHDRSFRFICEWEKPEEF